MQHVRRRMRRLAMYPTTIITYTCLLCIAGIFIISPRSTVECSQQARQVEIWAEQLGKELFDLGNIITKSSEIAQRYTLLKARVDRKDPQMILSQIVGDISRMMDRKMDAINCILRVAEEQALNYDFNQNYTDFQYYNSKYSPIGNDSVQDVPESILENIENYYPMHLNNDTHFYNIPVNTSYSSVHVPTNVYDRHIDPQMTIQWSEALDEVFTQNYKSDPALSWQYFGSSTGIMRHYPAMRWKQDEVDKFDCRIRTWFIEATTCTKDVVILLDNSGSMQGMRKHIASFTVYSILDTFSNNDFVNVLNYSTHVNYTVPCFKDRLVQATKENIQTFKHAVRRLDPDNKSDVEIAMVHAFDLLRRTREEKGCNDTDDSDCNQAIMLVTDGIKGNISNVFEKYNWFNNATNIPVRLFTYLIGAEVTKVNEIMWAACRNRGYYTHVQSLEQVAEDVFKYVPVIARPLVLQREQHPSSWTHAYADLTYDDENENYFNEPYRLLTSVAAPAFDLRANENNGSVVADVLGVAATDVPLDDIIKLTLPYKLGVMAYSFIVTNNGYVLFHPDLRPVFNKTILKENFNSVDLVEVEQLDDDSAPRDVGEQLLELRLALVNGEEGATHDVPIKYHFDDNRRVTRQFYDYYYAPIKNTPFTLALVLPDRFGNFSIGVGDMIEELKRKGAKLTEYFQGTNWKIHPKWVYCKYHYLEGHEFVTPESELLHFIKKMDLRDFQWHAQYETDNSTSNEFEEVQCGRGTLGNDDYFCNRELVQRLVFDAVNTFPSYEHSWKFRNREQASFQLYNVSLRFVATMSGLTRWEYIFGEDESNVKKLEFGDYSARAIDENWYKTAVLQYEYDPTSFVYTVPFEVGNSEDILVTASRAIFPPNIESPGAVAGFQFSHSHMQKRFFNITSEITNCRECIPCGDLLDCYVVDSSGYIVLSHDRNDTGRFFGEIEGAILGAMLDMGVFQSVSVYDFQALCLNETEDTLKAAAHQTKGFDFISILINSIVNKLIIMLMYISSAIASVDEIAFTKDPSYYEMLTPSSVELEPTEFNSGEDDDKDDGDVEEYEKVLEAPAEEEEPPVYVPCDQQRELYHLNQTKFRIGEDYDIKNEIRQACSRPFFIKKVRSSNLILVAINSSISQCDRYFSSLPINIVYENNTEHPCQKLSLNNLPRTRLQGCFNEHPLERNITICGKGTSLEKHSFIIGLLSTVLCVNKMIF